MPRQPKKPAEEKSRRVQFRLHPDVPDEATALDILAHWTDLGYDTRYIMTAALHALEGYDLPAPQYNQSGELQRIHRELLSEVRAMLVTHLNQSVPASGQPVYQSQSERPAVDSQTAAFAARLSGVIQSGLYDDDDDDA